MKQNPLQRLLCLVALALPVVPSAGQTPPAAPQGATPTSYIGTGPTTEADIARLRAAILKLPGVESMDITVRPGGVKFRVRGGTGGPLLAARSAGYTVRPTLRRSYFASGLSEAADTAGLREALGKIEGVERVEIAGPNGGASVRVLGDVKAATLVATARSAGFEFRRISSYVASGSPTATGIARLRKALEKVDGVSQVDIREVAGGATLRIQGAMEDGALTTAAKASGFGLLSLNDLVGGQFRVNGVTDTETEGKLRTALLGVAGVGDIQIRRTSEGTHLSVTGGSAIPEVIVAGAKAVGFYLQPSAADTASNSADVEQNTPPSPNDRILEELTKVGDLAPDFTLLTSDGKSKMSLSDSRGKKPVVLIFGSYT
jgi:copper chaperone CopZ